MQSPFRIFIIVLAVGALSAGAYFTFGNKTDAQSEPLLQSDVTGKAVGISQGNTNTDQTVQNVLRQINDLDQIKLNTDIFDKPEFLALKDISQDLPQPTDIGRPNPFAPIGVDIGVVPSDGENPGEVAGFPNADLALATSAVRTNEILNVGRTSATASAALTMVTITNRWFEYGTNQNTVNKTAKQTGTEVTFTATLGSLSPNTVYYVKAAVENNGVVTYGELVSFKTAQ